MSRCQEIWPTKGPDEILDYTLDTTTDLMAVSDSIASASVAVAPSGLGEMIPAQISVEGYLVTIWLSGGYAGRIYTVQVEITTVNRRTFQYPVIVPIDATFAAYPVTPPDSPDLCASIVWSGP